jgi:hypothetical protein
MIGRVGLPARFPIRAPIATRRHRRIARKAALARDLRIGSGAGDPG